MAWLKLFSFLLLVAVVRSQGQSQGPIAHVANGILQGTWRCSTNGRRFASFLGVPYAEAPIGENRFRDPQAARHWQGVRNATTVLSSCLQYDPLNNVVTGSEDCLFVNIHTPKLDAGALLPVVVFIHGGSFMFGAGGQYDAVHIMDRDVVFVTFNYRLGPLGFLSTGDDQIPGNTGLKDQSFVLKWVRDNIIHFGGNPDSITLTGHSSGAACVHYHYLSPLSKGTFHRGFACSGSAFDPWAYSTRPVEKARALSAIVGCSTASTRKMVDCLKNKPGEEIINAQIKMFDWSVRLFGIFTPTVEAPGTKNPFLTQYPYLASQAGAVLPVPLIASVTSEEGLYPAAAYQSSPEILQDLELRWEHLASNIFEYNDTLPLDQRSSVAEKIKQQYLNGKPVGEDTFGGLVQAIGERLFTVGAGKLAQIHAQKSLEPTYVYRISYRWQNSLTNLLAQNENNYGVCHGDDVILYLKYAIPDATRPQDIQMREAFLDMIYSYACSGEPKLPNSPEWLKVKPGRPKLDYLNIAGPEDMEMKSSADFGHKAFWDSLGFNENENYLV